MRRLGNARRRRRVHRSTSRIVIYTTPWCTLCERAKALLDARGLDYDEVDLGSQPSELRRTLRELTGGDSTPQVVIDGRPIGGWDDLAALDRAGALVAAAVA